MTEAFPFGGMGVASDLEARPGTKAGPAGHVALVDVASPAERDVDAAFPGAGFLVSVLGLLAVGGLAWAIIASDLGVAEDRIVFSIVLATGASAIALAGALLCFARFELIREREALAGGVILALSAAGWLLPARIGPMLRASWREEVGGFALGSSAMICAVVLTLYLLPEVDGRLTIVRHLIWAGAGVVAFGLIIANGYPDVVELDGRSGPAIGEVLAGPLLGMAAAGLLFLAYRRRRNLLAYLGIALLGLEAAELLAIRALRVDDAWWMAAALLSVASLSVALVGVMMDYRQAHFEQQQRVFEAWLNYQSTSRAAIRERAKHEETFHDLRAGLLGVEAVAASGALRHAAEDGVLTEELARLRRMASTEPGFAEPIDVTAFLESIIELRLRRGEAVSLDSPDVVPMVVDRHELAEVMFNLLDNAARHAPRSPVVVSVHPTGTEVEFAVMDRGPGIPADALDSVFNRGTTSHGEGSGLGLFIAAEVVDRLGGTLAVENRIGGGCRFGFTLPTGERGRIAAPTETVIDLRDRPKMTRPPVATTVDEQPPSGWTRRRNVS